MARTFGDPPHYYETSVDGEKWIVRQGRKPGSYGFTWVSGPNKNYGFASQSSDGGAMSIQELDQSIGEFLAEIDPETGYISDD